MRFHIFDKDGRIKVDGHVLPSTPLNAFLDGLKDTVDSGDVVSIKDAGLNVRLVDGSYWVQERRFVCNNSTLSTE
tara:strand:- start:216 stop:440 length:225 start_codon:yes stop_codon:yes gene_type:complete